MRYTFSRASEQAPVIFHSVSEVTAVWATAILKQGSRVFQLFLEWLNRDYEYDRRRRYNARVELWNSLHEKNCDTHAVTKWRKLYKDLRIILQGASLNGVFLEGADFMNANLTGAHITDCSLFKAIFVAAALDYAVFTHVDLTGADFRGASLYEAVFTDVTLDDADLTGVDVSHTSFVNVRAKNVKGLSPQVLSAATANVS